MATPGCSPAVPAPAIQDILLQQREERLHGRVVGAGRYPAHRATQYIHRQRHGASTGAKLTAAIGVNHCVARTALFDSIIECVDGKLRSHAVRHTLTDDPVGEGVLNHAQIQFPGSRRMFGDISQPH